MKEYCFLLIQPLFLLALWGPALGQPTISNTFSATGSVQPIVQLLENPAWPVPDELSQVAVEVTFDRLPTKMRFSLPCYPAMVTENNIHFSNGWTETYDPKASSSCEPLWDRDNRYARMWIESQNPARIIVRVRHAICDPEGYVCHDYIPSGSPYGKGDWTDEWYYIYPDGTHTRHVRIYSGLAGQSLLVTDEQFDDVPPVREIPPNVVHEFQEDFIFGLKGHLPGDDIETAPLTFIHSDGRMQKIAYDPYPEDYGTALKANIKLVNLKSEYKPFTISLPFGIENEPYPPEGDLPYQFQTWGGGDGEGYSTSLGHTLNWWHYRRTDHLLEQIYLSGMTDADFPTPELLAWERSWVTYPRLQMEGITDRYRQTAYDPAQRAYIIPGDHTGAKPIEFSLGFEAEDAEEAPIPVSIVNPVFILKNWGEKAVQMEIDGKALSEGTDYRIGYETQAAGTDLVIWVGMKANAEIRVKVKP